MSLCRNNTTINAHVKTQYWVKHRVWHTDLWPTSSKSLTRWPGDPVPSLVHSTHASCVSQCWCFLKDSCMWHWTFIYDFILRTTQWYRLLLLAAYGLSTAQAILCIVNGDDLAVFRSFLSLVTLTFDLDLRTRARFLYYAPNHQVWSSYVESFRNYRVDKQTNRRRWKHPPRSATLRRCQLSTSTVTFSLKLKPNSITLSGSNQLRTSSEPTSVMEFGFYRPNTQTHRVGRLHYAAGKALGKSATDGGVAVCQRANWIAPQFLH